VNTWAQLILVYGVPVFLLRAFSTVLHMLGLG